MKKIIAGIFGLCIIWILLFDSIHLWALNPNYYTSQYQEMKLAQSLEVSSKDLDRAITVLLDYIEGKREDISIPSKKQEVFNTREKEHMVDVKNLYQNVKKVTIGATIVAIAILLYLAHNQEGRFLLATGILEASFAFIVFIGYLGFWMAIDFNDFWTQFHQLFFTNDLWLLTPGVDFMIDMLPEQIFFQLVIRIVLTCVLLLAGTNGISWWIRKRNIGELQ